MRKIIVFIVAVISANYSQAQQYYKSTLTKDSLDSLDSSEKMEFTKLIQTKGVSIVEHEATIDFHYPPNSRAKTLFDQLRQKGILVDAETAFSGDCDGGPGPITE